MHVSLLQLTLVRMKQIDQLPHSKNVLLERQRESILAPEQNLVQVEELDGLNHLRIPAGQKYKSPGKLYVEGDASSASYWLAGMLNCIPKNSRDFD